MGELMKQIGYRKHLLLIENKYYQILGGVNKFEYACKLVLKSIKPSIRVLQLNGIRYREVIK